MKQPTIKLILLATLILLSCTTAHAQDDGTILMRRAAHCLAAKGFLRPPKPANMTFGYLIDERSYPGERELYVLNYLKPSRPNGFVFAIFLTEHDGRQYFNIQNNARYALSKNGDDGVSFVEEALGGTWTHERLIAAINQIEKQPRLTVKVESLLAVDSAVTCNAYSDPQPTSSAN